MKTATDVAVVVGWCLFAIWSPLAFLAALAAAPALFDWRWGR